MLQAPALDDKTRSILDAAFPPSEDETKTATIEIPGLNDRERIIDAYEVALTLASQMLDPDCRADAETLLFKSAVHGAIVHGVQGPDDVATMLQSVSKWSEIVANLGADSEVIVFQGELPERYTAFAANATVAEIDRVYGDQGLDLIKSKKGTHKDDKYYRCCVLPMPTNQLTVHITKDASGMDQVAKWFPGIEIRSRVYRNEGDSLVRMGVKPPRRDQGMQQPRHYTKRPYHGQSARNPGVR